MRRVPATLVALVASLGLVAAAVAATTPGMSLFGDLKYGPDFQHFDYVNPDAPKGGTMRLFAIGTFDTLNPLSSKAFLHLG
jgi:microcin C transport system substrate-binding protein